MKKEHIVETNFPKRKPSPPKNVQSRQVSFPPHSEHKNIGRHEVSRNSSEKKVGLQQKSTNTGPSRMVQDKKQGKRRREGSKTGGRMDEKGREKDGGAEKGGENGRTGHRW